MIIYAGLLLFGVFISAVSQVILKKQASQEHKSIWQEYLNIRVLLAYGMFFLATLFSVVAYRKLPLSLGVILDTSSYLFVTLFGVTIFKEKLNRQKIIALILIIAGILCCSSVSIHAKA